MAVAKVLATLSGEVAPLLIVSAVFKVTVATGCACAGTAPATALAIEAWMSRVGPGYEATWVEISCVADGPPVATAAATAAREASVGAAEFVPLGRSATALAIFASLPVKARATPSATSAWVGAAIFEEAVLPATATAKA